MTSDFSVIISRCNRLGASKVLKGWITRVKISKNRHPVDHFLKPTGGECAGTVVCPNTTYIDYRQGREMHTLVQLDVEYYNLGYNHP